MTTLDLEDFGVRPAPSTSSTPILPPQTTDENFDAAYNAGWDDAMTQIDGEQSRVGEQLANRVAEIERDQQAAIVSAVSALEPILHEIFDKLLPRAAERGFLTLLLEEVEQIMAEGAGQIVLLVAPEEAPAMAKLLERAKLDPDHVTVRGEPAMSLSQAFVRWENQERRIDLQAVLSALDDALEGFLTSIKEEAQND